MISLVAIVCNEAARMPGFIARHSPLVDRIIVVVQESTDDTLSLASAGADVVLLDRCHGISEPSRSLALSACPTGWALVLDADEQLTDWAADRLRGWTSVPGLDLLSLRRETTIDGQVIEDMTHLRLFRVGRVLWDGRIHSSYRPAPGAGCASITETVCINHHKTSAEQIADDRRYATLT